MKNRLSKFTMALALAVGATLAAQTLFNPTPRILQWDYPDTNSLETLSFRVYTSPRADVPLSLWTLFTNLPATNLVRNQTTNSDYMLLFQQIPKLQFFVITASNSFYKVESDFSNVALTPAPPSLPQHLFIK